MTIQRYLASWDWECVGLTTKLLSPTKYNVKMTTFFQLSPFRWRKYKTFWSVEHRGHTRQNLEPYWFRLWSSRLWITTFLQWKRATWLQPQETLHAACFCCWPALEWFTADFSQSSFILVVNWKPAVLDSCANEQETTWSEGLHSVFEASYLGEYISAQYSKSS